MSGPAPTKSVKSVASSKGNQLEASVSTRDATSQRRKSSTRSNTLEVDTGTPLEDPSHILGPRKSVASLKDVLEIDMFRRLSIKSERGEPIPQFKLYPSRWLVLIGVTNFMVYVGFEKSFFALSDVLYDNLDVTYADATSWWPAGMSVLILSILPMSMALNKYGLRMMTHIAACIGLTAHLLIATSMLPDEHPLNLPKGYRFAVFTIGSMGVQWVVATQAGFPAKMAATWFSDDEASRAIMVWTLGYGISSGFINYFMPEWIKDKSGLPLLSYFYVGMGLLLCLTTFLFIRRSQPEHPPSLKALLSNESSNVGPRDSFQLMFTTPQFVLGLLALTMNQTAIAVLIGIMLDVMKSVGYDRSLCGNMISNFSIVGFPPSILAAMIMDKTGRFIGLSRISCGLQVIMFAAFSWAIQQPDQRLLVIVTNVLLSCSNAFVIQSLYQVSLRTFAGILPESFVMASAYICYGIGVSVMSQLFKPLRRPDNTGHENEIPMIVYTLINATINILYLALYQMPDRQKLKQRLATKMESQIEIKERYRNIEAT